jgi:hypothetical protein
VQVRRTEKKGSRMLYRTEEVRIQTVAVQQPLRKVTVIPLE